MNHTSKPYDAIIIGGGLGGLVCALALIKRGKKVRLLEKIHMVGGCQGYFKRKGFLFEPCLHSIAEASANGAVVQTLASLGLDETPAFVKLEPTARFIFDDKIFTMPSNFNDYQTLLTQDFPQEALGIEKLYKTMNEIYQGLGRFPERVPIIERYSGLVFQQILDEFVSNKRLQAIISGFWGYTGAPPSQASALLYSAWFASLCSEGSYLPQKGISHLVKSLEQAVIERGGEISLNSPVKKVLIKNGKAYGVLLESGEEIKGEAIVSNTDATTTFFQMVGEENLPSDFILQLKKLNYALSSFNVFLGVKNGNSLPHDLAAENIIIFPDDDLDSQYQRILQGKLEKVPYCIAMPTLQNPSLAPKGHHIISLYTPLPYRPEGITNWKDKKEEYTERLISLAENVIPGLKQKIVVKEAATPDTIVRFTGNSHGVSGGWAYTPDTDAGRPANRTPIEGLWLTGHWTFPGLGINNVIKSGCLTASLIP
ncbi:MAG: NAD(P)/FAD-dependent oxidoreductase [Deltaproteobacteria bacterium]|nr:NAD(P)/FAD-dependent oxidoreductase [Deltaproteobacteria bacterium]